MRYYMIVYVWLLEICYILVETHTLEEVSSSWLVGG